MLPALVASYIVGVLFHEGGFNGWGALADFNSFLLLQREAVKNIESTPQERTQFWRSVLKQDLLNLVIAGKAAQAKEKVLDAVNSFRTQSQDRPR